MSGITLKETAAGSVATPATDKVTIFIDSATGEPSYKDDTGTTSSMVGPAGATGPTGPSGGAGGASPGVCEFRLTLESGVAVSTTDQTAKTTIYLTPYRGNTIALYSGSAWAGLASAQVSLALGTLTSGKNYDVFAYDNSGTLTLELSAAWASDTARTDALTTQDGVLVKSGATTRRYMGTFRTTSTTTTEDSQGGVTTNVGGKRFLWNLYNQKRRSAQVIDTTDTWTYNTTTWRQARATAGNKVEFVIGIAEDEVVGDLVANTDLNNLSGGTVAAGIGVDSTTAPSGIRSDGYMQAGSSVNIPLTGLYRGSPGIGYHYLAWLEKGNSGTAAVFTGDDGADGSQSGLTVTIIG